MKNNVITIFIDSVSWNSIGHNRAAVNPMPFISSLRSESITASHLYSHGPYTDAAVRSLFTGRNCLDDFGYYYRLNTSPINDFKLFHEAGYETYGFYYPFIMYGNEIKKYIDHTFYTAGFIFGSEWGGSFKYYHEKLKEGALNSTDKILLKKRFDLFFEVFESYIKELINNKESRIIYDKCLEGYNVEAALETFLNEKNNYEENPQNYIDEFLHLAENHILWDLDTTRIDKVVDSSFLDEIVKENKDFFNQIKKLTLKANWRSIFHSLDLILLDFKEAIRKKSPSELVFFKKYVKALKEFDVMIKRWHRPEWQVAHTSHTILQAGLDVIRKNNLGKNRPFYMSLNTEDPHANLAMFAYDIQDKKEVNDEIRVLRNYVKELGANFNGSLLYLLSLRYVDYEVEKFCNQLKELGLWDNTTIMILSDHGSAFTNSPIRRTSVNCFDEECYHIPVVLRHPGFKGIQVDDYKNSKDILPTVCDLLGIEKSPFFKGHSMLDNTIKPKPYVLTEYMGPGCPDLLSRRMWLSARDSSFLVAYKVGIFEDFEEGELAEVYDYKKDPKGLVNIASKIDKRKIEYLLHPLRIRYEEIKHDTLEILKSYQ